jgi:hypothetical protein
MTFVESIPFLLVALQILPNLAGGYRQGSCFFEFSTLSLKQTFELASEASEVLWIA